MSRLPRRATGRAGTRPRSTPRWGVGGLRAPSAAGSPTPTLKGPENAATNPHTRTDVRFFRGVANDRPRRTEEERWDGD